MSKEERRRLGERRRRTRVAWAKGAVIGIAALAAALAGVLIAGA